MTASISKQPKPVRAASGPDQHAVTVRLHPQTVAAIVQADKAARAAKRNAHGTHGTTTTHRARNSGLHVISETDDFAREQVTGFVDFLREHAIVGLAVGFVVGTQAQTVVKQLIDSFISPLLGVIFGTLSAKKFYWNPWGHGQDFKWGAMVYALINLFFVLATIYALIKVLNLDKLDKPKDAKPAK